MLIYTNLTCILIENFPAPVICDCCFQCCANKTSSECSGKIEQTICKISMKTFNCSKQTKNFHALGTESEREKRVYTFGFLHFQRIQSECKQYLNQVFFGNMKSYSPWKVLILQFFPTMNCLNSFIFLFNEYATVKPIASKN